MPTMHLDRVIDLPTLLFSTASKRNLKLAKNTPLGEQLLSAKTPFAGITLSLPIKTWYKGNPFHKHLQQQTPLDQEVVTVDLETLTNLAADIDLVLAKDQTSRPKAVKLAKTLFTFDANLPFRQFEYGGGFFADLTEMQALLANELSLASQLNTNLDAAESISWRYVAQF